MAASRSAHNHVSATSRLSVNIPSSSRVSMEEYYYRQNNDGWQSPCCLMDGADSPPSYDASIQRRRYNVQPREDEGRETLPPYSSAISLENVFLKKMELEGAIHRAQDRNWFRVFVTLQGTALTFHKFKASNVFSRIEGGGKHSPDFPPGTKDVQLLKSYNLQHADVGIAADYLKKSYVIRVRAETDQFLLSCVKIETFVLWLESLFAAIDLASPLDDRDLPMDQSLPRTRRRRGRAAFRGMEHNAELIREQEEIMRTQYPNLAADIPEDETTSVSPGPSSPNATQDERPDGPSSAMVSASSGARPLVRPLVRPPRGRLPASSVSRPPRNRATTSSTPNPSISPETGKWRPEHDWGPTYDLMYAKRCLAILTDRSPRKTNLVIVKGKRWIVDWATGVFTKCDPPDYAESERAGCLKPEPNGTMTKV